MKKLLILGSVVSPCPPKKQGGTERVAYYQAKHLSKHGLPVILVGAKETKQNFTDQLIIEESGNADKILQNIEFVEIGGGTAFGSQEDAFKLDTSIMEASRKLRLEMVNLAKVQEFLVKRKDSFDLILNNMRGEAVFLPLAKILNKKLVNVMHLNFFPELAQLLKTFNTPIITISNSQRDGFPGLNYLATIYNPISTDEFVFEDNPEDYALMVSTIGTHKNQKDALLASREAKIPLVLAGKIRDQDYFDKEIKPFVDGIKVVYHGELNFEAKLRLYQKAKVFLFPIKWQEPFGLVVIEALSCGTPVVAYPHGGVSEIVKEGENGYFAKSPSEMAEKIKEIEKIKREDCRKDVIVRFSEEIIGNQYFEVLNKLI